jgi:integrase
MAKLVGAQAAEGRRLTRGHHAALAYSDIAEFVQRLRTEQAGNTAALALQFLILTATRTTEVLHMTFDEVSFADAVWQIPASRMKTGEAFSVPLSDAALRLLGDQMGGKSAFVFRGGLPKKPLSSMALAMLMRRMNVDATVHGFRTSFRTWCSDIRHVEFEVAESCLSHRVGSAVSRAYARSDMLERRRPIMESWSRYVTGADAANVVSISKPRIRAPYRRA